MARSGATVAFASLWLASAGHAQEIINPSWSSIPSGEEMTDAYPQFASMVGFDGQVTLRCTVTVDGALALCRTTAATPGGLGFDRAALSLTSQFRVSPRQVDGDPTKGGVRFTIRFRMPETTPSQWTGPEPSPEQLSAVHALFKNVTQSEGPMPMWDFPTDLQVDADREERVRALVIQVEQEWRDRHENAAALALARLLTPEQLAALENDGTWPPPPDEDLMANAGDGIEKVTQGMSARLRQLYCAEFDCSDVAATAP